MPPSIVAVPSGTSDGFLLFEPERQKVIRAHPAVAEIWPRLRAGLPAGEAADLIGQSGLDGIETLATLIAEGVLVEARFGREVTNSASVARVGIGRTTILLAFEQAEIVRDVEPVFGHLLVPDDRAVDSCVTLRRVRKGTAISPDGQRPVTFPPDGVASGLKVALTEAAFEFVELMILHAATLTNGCFSMLLFGGPGAGKTTLAFGTSRLTVLQIAGDDLAELQADGSVVPLPFAAAVKEGAVPILAPIAEGLERMRTHVRPDGKVVRYLAPDRIAPGPLPVGWAIALRREDGASARLEPLPVPDMIRFSLTGAWSQSGTVTSAAFTALSACLSSAQCLALTYSDLSEAAALLQDLAMDGVRPVDLNAG